MTLTIYLILDATASDANPASKIVHSEIVALKGVTAPAMCLAGIHRRATIASENISPMRQNAQMLRINAPSVVAHMIYGESLRNRAKEYLVRKSMGIFNRPSSGNDGDIYLAVARFLQRACPLPAIIIGFPYGELLKKAFEPIFLGGHNIHTIIGHEGLSTAK